jgi:hypothetical protein
MWHYPLCCHYRTSRAGSAPICRIFKKIGKNKVWHMLIPKLFPNIPFSLVLKKKFEKNNIPKISAFNFRIIFRQSCLMGMVSHLLPLSHLLPCYPILKLFSPHLLIFRYPYFIYMKYDSSNF